MVTSAKLIGYFRIAGVRHYLVIDPDARTVVHHSRETDAQIVSATLASGEFKLDPPGLIVRLTDFFG